MLWVVCGAYGIWVVRAPSEDAAITVAERSDSFTGWAEYGLRRSQMRATELPAEGEPAVLDHMYA